MQEGDSIKASSRPTRAPRGRRLVGVVALALVLTAGGVGVTRLTARSSAAATPPAPPASVPVSAITVASQSIDLVRTGLGVVTAWSTATITPQVSGALTDLPFQEGTHVNQGDAIARIDPKPFQAVLDQDVAKKAQDEASLANDNVNLKRDSDLAVKKVGTQQQADNDAAAVNQMQAQVQGDQAAIDAARIQLGYTTITAPFAGMLGIRTVDVGNVVTPTTAIVMLTEIEPIAVVFSLPQDDLGALQAAASHGKPVVLAYDQQGKNLIARGTLDVINNVIDQATGTIKLKARFDNPDHKLWPGQFVQVRVVTETEPDGIGIPSAAVQRGTSGPYVWLLNPDNTAQMQPVGIVQVQEGMTVIGSGIAAGNRVVVNGQYGLTPGAKVSEIAAQTGAQPVGAGTPAKTGRTG
jgi:multidrug efflux system membrane fusion protein